MKCETFDLDSLQIYFPSSLEIQKELLDHGLKIPYDPTNRNNTKFPLPIIYSDSRSWKNKAFNKPITSERLIPPEWYGEEVKWREESVGRRTGYFLPPEYSKVKICVDDRNTIIYLEEIQYHLEKTSIRRVGPEIWNNWLMFYIPFTEHNVNKLKSLCQYGTSLTINLKPKREIQQGSKEKTYYFHLKVADFNICLGCFDKALNYLKIRSSQLGYNFTSDIKLKIRQKDEYTYLKFGIAEIEGKEKQFMFKLSSSSKEIQITGIDGKVIKGKARGELEYCDHRRKMNYIMIETKEFCDYVNFFISSSS